jgi:hypothetical protein
MITNINKFATKLYDLALKNCTGPGCFSNGMPPTRTIRVDDLELVVTSSWTNPRKLPFGGTMKNFYHVSVYENGKEIFYAYSYCGNPWDCSVDDTNVRRIPRIVKKFTRAVN